LGIGDPDKKSEATQIDRRQDVSTVRASSHIPAYVAGTWMIDPVHSDVSFKVRHLMIANVRGKFHSVDGAIVLADDPHESRVMANIDVSSIDTGDAQRDNDIRSAAFLNAEEYPTMTYRSKAVHPRGEAFVIDGELSLHGVTRDVELQAELNGFGKDPYGAIRVGFTAVTQISRRDFGIMIDMPLDGGGLVIGDTVEVFLEIEGVLASPSSEAL